MDTITFVDKTLRNKKSNRKEKSFPFHLLDYTATCILRLGKDLIIEFCNNGNSSYITRSVA